MCQKVTGLFFAGLFPLDFYLYTWDMTYLNIHILPSRSKYRIQLCTWKNRLFSTDSDVPGIYYYCKYHWQVIKHSSGLLKFGNMGDLHNTNQYTGHEMNRMDIFIITQEEICCNFFPLVWGHTTSPDQYPRTPLNPPYRQLKWDITTTSLFWGLMLERNTGDSTAVILETMWLMVCGQNAIVHNVDRQNAGQNYKGGQNAGQVGAAWTKCRVLSNNHGHLMLI